MPLTYYTFASLEGYLVGVNVNGNSRKGDSYSCAVYFSIVFEFIIARVHCFYKDHRYLCAYVHVFLELTLFKEKAGKNCLFLFRAGRDCNYCFQVFSEKLPCPYYLTLKIYHLEMVCFLSFCILDVWCKNVYTCTHTHACKHLLTHQTSTPKIQPF